MDKNAVQSVERTFAIMEALSQVPDGICLNDLSKAVGLNKSTVHRLLSSLISLGYASKIKDTGEYILTMKMFEVGSKVSDRFDILKIARPYLQELSKVVGEAVHLVIRDGNDVIYIFKEDSGNNSVCMSSRIGFRAPLYCTAVGKAIMSELPEEDVKHILETSSITQRTANTITSHSKMLEYLKVVKECGYAVDDEENEIGVRCVAACITSSSGKVLGAFSVSAPTGRMDNERLTHIADKVLKIKMDICSHL
jgi:DNA-binding IclR family transcriptional regulator